MKHTLKIVALSLVLALGTSLLAACSTKSASSGSTSTDTSTSASTSEETAYDYSAGLTEEGFFENVKALDYVTLPKDYNKISLPTDTTTVKDEDIQSQIDSFLKSLATKEQLKDRAVVDGDTVNIDYVGSVDGKEFDGGSTGGKGTDVTIGVTQYIDDFLDQLVGHKPGETFDVNVTFPADYGKEDLNGKDAVFKTTINYVSGEDVVPELTDALVKEKLGESRGWNDIATMRSGISEQLKSSQIASYVWNYVLENATVKEVPESLVEYQKSSMLAYYKSMAAQYGIDFKTFLTSMQIESEEALIEQQMDSINSNAKDSLLVQAIAEDAKLKVTEENTKAFFKKAVGTEDYSAYETQFGKPYVAMMVIFENAHTYLQENAVEA